SSWDDPFEDDHARVLNARGQASAVAVGDWLALHGYIPNLMLCSDAIRTQQTAELIMPMLLGETMLRLSGAIYHAAPDTVLDMLRRETAETIAVIGHNPGIGTLANELVATAPQHHRFSGYPTCATTVIDFAIDDWSALRHHQGECVEFVVPRDLIGTAGRDAD
uniref:SixA phosphatase family protein n=1 Tax=Yoonia sp. TaxID=2212373 RepID=UPI0025FC4B69